GYVPRLHLHSFPTRRSSDLESVGSPPENCTDIWRRGLMAIALSSSVLISSQVSSCTNPTWFASIKHGSHIILQRLVRSMVRTEPDRKSTRLNSSHRTISYAV